jgi:hypothetical protein
MQHYQSLGYINKLYKEDVVPIADLIVSFMPTNQANLSHRHPFSCCAAGGKQYYSKLPDYQLPGSACCFVFDHHQPLLLFD